MRGEFLTGRHRLTGLALILLVALAAIVNFELARSSPDPAPVSSPDTEFSAERAMETVEAIASEPRPVGSEAADRARDHLTDRLADLGFTVETPTTVGTAEFGGKARFAQVDNIVATMPGTDPTGEIMLVSHYDSVPAGPGAADAAAGVAAVVETARALTADGPLRNDLTVLITDGEEAGLIGAESYARDNPPTRPTVVLNLEARGASGASIMFETSEDNAALVDAFASHAPATRGDSSSVEIYRRMENNTDFTRFNEAGYWGLNAAFLEDPHWYHTPGDDTGNLDPASVQHHGENTLGVARGLSGLDLATLEADHDASYFHMFNAIVSYSAELVWIPAAAAAALWLLALALARRRRQVSLPRTTVAIASVPVLLAAVFAAGWGYRLLLFAVRPDFADVNGILYRPGAFEAASFALAAALTGVWFFALRRWLGPAALTLGVYFWLAAGGLALSLTVPGAGFLLSVPALCGLAGLLIARSLARGPAWVAGAVAALGAVPGTALLWSAASDSFVAFGLGGTDFAPAVFALGAGMLVPFAAMCLRPPSERMRKRWTLGVPAAAAALAVLLTATGLAVERPDSEHPKRTHLAYLLDSETGTGSWISVDEGPDSWVEGYAPDTSPPELPYGFDDSYAVQRHGDAPAVDVAAPAYDIVERSGSELTLEVSSPRGAPRVWMAVDGDVETVTARYPGREPVSLRPQGQDPAVVDLLGVPAEGVTVTLETGGAEPSRISLFDETHGLDGVPGYEPRPDDRTLRAGSVTDTVTVWTAVDLGAQ
ncbi:M20/M25/M40 family metallo-hydrolase [Salininema proteolyticum]|uniref:M20/M25/M40 family metallo-hydrolase n=1 Tax=Salininema proteolyticum TaxID=1607685 RepID=A0ABV8TW81_9ACTN